MKELPVIDMVDPKSMEVGPLAPSAVGGGLEGAKRTSRETFSWDPVISSPDAQINSVKESADARSVDSVQNDGYATGATYTHKDSIVGSKYMLNARPDIVVLGATDGWAEEFQEIVEGRFNLMSDSEECWFDAEGVKTLTGIIRLAVGGFMMTGEVLGTAEWLREARRPFRTAFQMVSPSRLCNPNYDMDTPSLRRGVQKDFNGRPIGYYIKVTHPGDYAYNLGQELDWRYVPAMKPWGRRQVIHIIEQMRPSQTRGIADMVSALKNMRMTRKFQEVVLQNAVVNASYAAAVESELPREAVFASMGAGGTGFQSMLGDYMSALQKYVGGSENIAVDGVKMPHLFPGTKLNMKPMGTPGGVGTDFEESLLRHTAAALGLSYEQFSRDYSKTNYSSARASMTETWKFMQGRKKMVADRVAKAIYVLWLEEEINAGNIPLPPGMKALDFYDPVKREALCACDWIGASRGQIDEKKETESSVLRINNNLSTLETECARLGLDYRQVLRQRGREANMMKKYGLAMAGVAQNNPNDKAAETAEQSDEKVGSEDL
jgi:lambda family phage portal protein